jgi:hypothetical protein
MVFFIHIVPFPLRLLLSLQRLFVASTGDAMDEDIQPLSHWSLERGSLLYLAIVVRRTGMLGVGCSLSLGVKEAVPAVVLGAAQQRVALLGRGGERLCAKC